MHDGLCGNDQVAIACHSGTCGSSSRSGQTADQGTLAATGDAADQSAQTGSPGDKSRGTLALALLAAQYVTGLQRVFLAVQRQECETQLDVGGTFEMPPPMREIYATAYGRSFGNDGVSAAIGNRFHDFAGESFACATALGADPLIDADRER